MDPGVYRGILLITFLAAVSSPFPNFVLTIWGIDHSNFNKASIYIRDYFQNKLDSCHYPARFKTRFFLISGDGFKHR